MVLFCSQKILFWFDPIKAHPLLAHWRISYENREIYLSYVLRYAFDVPASTWQLIVSASSFVPALFLTFSPVRKSLASDASWKQDHHHGSRVDWDPELMYQSLYFQCKCVWIIYLDTRVLDTGTDRQVGEAELRQLLKPFYPTNSWSPSKDTTDDCLVSSPSILVLENEWDPWMNRTLVPPGSQQFWFLTWLTWNASLPVSSKNSLWYKPINPTLLPLKST